MATELKTSAATDDGEGDRSWSALINVNNSLSRVKSWILVMEQCLFFNLLNFGGGYFLGNEATDR